MNRITARALLVWIAGGALLIAMVVDTLAMLGRQLRWPLLGSIEIVQAAVLFAACGGLVVAARERAHARVHLLLDRMTGRARAFMTIINEIASALLYLTLLFGSIWVAAELWHGQEESELLRLPYRPLRIVSILTVAWLLLLALRSAWRAGTRR